eukprot:CAMPEP_0170261584 /NCGR_PEP_ID=MMETSP0116_2-20130129/30673_1 /TAXON_ID=400756 /ORGANISM="Durinskia baltica, Strain CSIRO CS-38" /LENGTH=112 /DNA_ID=CAMNT_0010512649 /DNA_START=70 /DNA_END=408 /DNA_ORIENTATION=-
MAITNVSDQKSALAANVMQHPSAAHPEGKLDTPRSGNMERVMSDSSLDSGDASIDLGSTALLRQWTPLTIGTLRRKDMVGLGSTMNASSRSAVGKESELTRQMTPMSLGRLV